MLGVSDLPLVADRPNNPLPTGCDHDLVAVQEFDEAGLEVRNPVLHARGLLTETSLLVLVSGVIEI